MGKVVGTGITQLTLQEMLFNYKSSGRLIVSLMFPSAYSYHSAEPLPVHTLSGASHDHGTLTSQRRMSQLRHPKKLIHTNYSENYNFGQSFYSNLLLKNSVLGQTRYQPLHLFCSSRAGFLRKCFSAAKLD